MTQDCEHLTQPSPFSLHNTHRRWPAGLFGADAPLPGPGGSSSGRRMALQNTLTKSRSCHLLKLISLSISKRSITKTVSSLDRARKPWCHGYPVAPLSLASAKTGMALGVRSLKPAQCHSGPVNRPGQADRARQADGEYFTLPTLHDKTPGTRRCHRDRVRL